MKRLNNRFSWDQTWQGRQATLDLTTLILWRKFLEHVDLRNRSYLEIGAGRGVFGKLALEAGASQVCLLDQSAEAMRICREYIGEDARVSYVVENAIDFHPAEKFDVVLSNGLIEHFLDEDQRLIVEAHAANSRDLVVLMAPASPHFNDRRVRYAWALKLYGPQYPLRVEQMRAILEQASLEPILVERFYPTYGIKLDRLFASRSRLRGLIDLALLKVGFYHALHWATSPLGKRFGGYLIGIGRVQRA